MLVIVSDHLLQRSLYTHTHTHTHTLPALNQSKCHWVSPGSVQGDIHILLCYILQPQQRRHRDWMPPSLCQKAAVSSTILVFQKYGLPGRRGAAGRAGRAEWHSWFPVLWADYCCLFSNCLPTLTVKSTSPTLENFSFRTDVNQLWKRVTNTLWNYRSFR